MYNRGQSGSTGPTQMGPPTGNAGSTKPPSDYSAYGGYGELIFLLFSLVNFFSFSFSCSAL